MIGVKITITKNIAELGKNTRFGPHWTGLRCGARTRSGEKCKRPAHKINGKCSVHGGCSTGPKTIKGRKAIAAANTKHGRSVKEKIKAQKHSAAVGRYVKAELKKIEQQLRDANLIDY